MFSDFSEHKSKLLILMTFFYEIKDKDFVENLRKLKYRVHQSIKDLNMQLFSLMDLTDLHGGYQ